MKQNICHLTQSYSNLINLNNIKNSCKVIIYIIYIFTQIKIIIEPRVDLSFGITWDPWVWQYKNPPSSPTYKSTQLKSLTGLTSNETKHNLSASHYEYTWSDLIRVSQKSWSPAGHPFPHYITLRLFLNRKIESLISRLRPTLELSSLAPILIRKLGDFRRQCRWRGSSPAVSRRFRRRTLFGWLKKIWWGFSRSCRRLLSFRYRGQMRVTSRRCF